MNCHRRFPQLYIRTSRALLIIAISLIALPDSNAATIRTFTESSVLAHAEGVGSLPSLVLRDGTVCAIPSAGSLRCTPLVQIPSKVSTAIGNDRGQLDGLFDLFGDGAPQIFVEYWPKSDDAACPPQYRDNGDEFCNAIVLLVYRDSSNGYHLDFKSHADSLGYGGGTWFLKETPRKAIFETRCLGSSGGCLFYLNWRKHKLELIDGTPTLQRPLTFEHFDGDSNSSIFVANRGYDRNGWQGAALIRWTGKSYQLWWPGWYAPPYVMYAQLANLDGTKDIVAVLDPSRNPEQGSVKRELVIWRLNSGKWCRIAETALQSVADAESMAGFPTLDKITPRPGGGEIQLSNYNDESFICLYSDRKLTCPESSRAAK